MHWSLAVYLAVVLVQIHSAYFAVGFHCVLVVGAAVLSRCTSRCRCWCWCQCCSASRRRVRWVCRFCCSSSCTRLIVDAVPLLCHSYYCQSLLWSVYVYPVGYTKLSRLSDHDHVGQIFLLCSFQRRGHQCHFPCDYSPS